MFSQKQVQDPGVDPLSQTTHRRDNKRYYTKLEKACLLCLLKSERSHPDDAYIIEIITNAPAKLSKLSPATKQLQYLQVQKPRRTDLETKGQPL